MEITEKIVGYEGLAKILGYTPKYLATLRSKHPERVPPPTRTSKTKWHIDVVNEWLKEDRCKKPKLGRPNNRYNTF